MAGFRHDIAGGDGDLIATSVQSPNYVPGVTGWQVARNGNAEFNNVTVRGTFIGTDYIINDAGVFFYSSAPAFGNLVASVAASAGTDGFGNAYLNGSASYAQLAPGVWRASQVGGGAYSVWSATSAGGAWALAADVDVDAAGDLVLQPASGSLRVLGGPISSTAGTSANPTLITTDTWQTLTTANGWTVPAGGRARVMLMPDDTVMLDLFLTAGTITDFTQVISPLSATYRPANQMDFTCATAGGTTAKANPPVVVIFTDGTTEVVNLPTGCTGIRVLARYPKD